MSLHYHNMITLHYDVISIFYYCIAITLGYDVIPFMMSLHYVMMSLWYHNLTMLHYIITLM